MTDNTRKNKHSSSAILGAYMAHFAALKRFIGRFFVSNQHDVDDVVQEAFLRAYKAELNKKIDQPKSYLFRIAKNVALDQLRKNSCRPTDYLEDLDAPNVMESEWTLEDEVMAQQQLGIHCAAVASLPPKCRKVYLMRKVYAMSHKDIAKELNITVSTVETHIERGFNRCADYIEAHMQEGVLDARAMDVMAVDAGVDTKSIDKGRSL
jgi:RNA polymerase sigma-70 factor (ECF subfamily)